ncbi:hypothetical protein Jiend_30010 [Micromonospora endophytica]|nr:hypothetical protein Jiend_30010 [Micromonospora endophytica]
MTWMTRPTCLLAGHDYAGWDWIDDLAQGTIVHVTTGPCAGRYRVVDNRWHARKGGPVPSWMGRFDLVLQTCTGASGTGFSLAQRL